jgi:hypothetical protein
MDLMNILKAVLSSANEVSEFIDLLKERDFPFSEGCGFSETERKVFFAIFGNTYTMQEDAVF